jgi:hypothetical protein
MVVAFLLQKSLKTRNIAYLLKKNHYILNATMTKQHKQHKTLALSIC